MKILYYGSGWPTNIGNAFIDYGSIYTIRTAMPGAQVFCASEIPRWLFKTNREDMDNSIDLAELMDIDFLVVSGMTLCDEFIEVQGPVLKRLSKRGVKIVFNGCGGSTYKKIEVDNFRKFLEGIRISGFISRDKISYNNFKDYSHKSYNGIDCAFFLYEAFNPAPLTIKDYVIYNFDHMEEPKIEEHKKKIIRTNHASFKILPGTLTNKRSILTINKRWPFIRVIKNQAISKYFSCRDILISDIPDDYLHLYANAPAVYSDRVHACIATLSFGSSAKLFSNTPRGNLFDRVGADEIRKRLVKLDQDKLKIDKEKQISFLKEIFEEE